MDGPDDYFGEDPADYPALACHECGGTGEVVGPGDIELTCPVCGGGGGGGGDDHDANKRKEGGG
jgi:hypothetical protein